MIKANIITGIDVGTSLVKVLVASKKPTSQDFEILAQVVAPSIGVRKGQVVDVEKLAERIHSAIEKAQMITRQRCHNAFINIGGGHISIVPSHGAVAVSRADQKISQQDIDRAIQSAQALSLPANREILAVFPKEFIIDREKGIKQALNMQGIRLEVEVLALSVSSPYLKNLTDAVLASGIQRVDVVPSALASARAVLGPRQKELGVAVIDIGAGTTDLAVYEEGDLIHTAVFPVGSFHITNDIAIGLRTEIDIAERIKKEFGTCLYTRPKKGSKEKVEFSDGSSSLLFSQKLLARIIEARVSEIFDLTNKELKKINRQKLLPAGIVLTGGGAQLSKIVELARRDLELPAKIGIPRGFLGIEEKPYLSTACGLILESDGSEEGESSSLLVKGIFDKLRTAFRVFIP